MGWRKTEHACSLFSRAMWLMGLLFIFRLCFIDYHGRRSGQFHHLQKMSRSNHWHGDQMEKVKTMKFKAENNESFHIVYFCIDFFILCTPCYSGCSWIQQWKNQLVPHRKCRHSSLHQLGRGDNLYGVGVSVLSGGIPVEAGSIHRG